MTQTAVAICEQANAAVMQGAALNAADLKRQVAIVHQSMKAVMKVGLHYGTIPGCGNKPVLLKPGAEVLAFAFQLTPKYDIQQTNFEHGHREYLITCEISHRPTGGYVGQGIGSASTMEKKFSRGNPADMYNTCLKMAKKRAFVDAILTCTAASDCFTQDIEDDPESFGAPRGSYVRMNLREIDAMFQQCATLEALGTAIGGLGMDKQHPDAQAVADLYNKHKAAIEESCRVQACEAEIVEEGV